MRTELRAVNDLNVGEQSAKGVPAFLAEARKIVGPEYVVNSPEEIEVRCRDTVPGRTLPSGIVYPNSTHEVSQLVALANQFKIPLWPHGSGRNWGWSNSPLQSNAIVVSLERMNRIHHVDENLAYAVIEPGVTYESLNNYLRERGIKLWTDCIGGPPKGSVLGNALDRGVGVTTHGDHFASLCGLEVVMPNGKVMNSGGYPDGKTGTRHTYKWGIGPYVEGIFSQANLGIVTQAGIWLMPEPESYQMFGFTLKDESKFAELLDVLRRLALDGVIPDKIRVTNDFAVLTIITQKNQETTEGKGRLTDDDLKRIGEKYQIGAWGFCSSIYGRKEQVQAMRKIVAKELAPYGKLVFIDDRKVKWINKLMPLALRMYKKHSRVMNFLSHKFLKISLPMLRTVPPLYQIYQGVPTEQIVRRAYFRSNIQRPEKDIHVAKDGVGLIWFGPMVPNEGKVVYEIMDKYRKRFAECDFDCYITVLMLNARTLVPLMGIIYRKDDPAETQRAQELYRELYADALSRGYQQFRCSRLGWNSIYEKAPEVLEIHRKIKDALDPNHIIAPGKFGIK